VKICNFYYLVTLLLTNSGDLSKVFIVFVGININFITSRTYAKVRSLRHYEGQRRNRKNPGIASLDLVSVAMINFSCVSPQK